VKAEVGVITRIVDLVLKTAFNFAAYARATGDPGRETSALLLPKMSVSGLRCGLWRATEARVYIITSACRNGVRPP
jgi:hypothetical protein